MNCNEKFKKLVLKNEIDTELYEVKRRIFKLIDGDEE